MTFAVLLAVLTLGYDSVNHRIVTEGRAYERCAADMIGVRDRARRVAELQAKARMIMLSRQFATGKSELNLQSDGVAGSKTVETAWSVFANAEMPLCRTVEAKEWTEKGYYRAVVRLESSAELKDRFARSMSGEIAPAANWCEELAAFLQQNSPHLAPTEGVFEDSNGFVHRFSTAIADISDGNLQRRRMRFRLAGQLADQRLRLAWFGDESIRKFAAGKLRVASSGQGENEQSMDKICRELMNVSASSVVPNGCEVLSLPFNHPQLNKKMCLVVWAVKQ